MNQVPNQDDTPRIGVIDAPEEIHPAAELTQVNEIVRSLAARPLSEEVQEQLGRLQSIIDAYEPGTLGKDYVESLLVAAKALSAETPNVLLAQGILWDLEFYLIYSGNGASYYLAKFTGGWPMVTAAIGMLLAISIFLCFWLSFVLLDYFDILPKFLWSGGPELPTSVLFGVLGGAMSILTRISRPVDLQKINPISLFLNCTFKPLVGGIF